MSRRLTTVGRYGPRRVTPPPVEVQIGANANDVSFRWPPAKGINNFANIVQHEQWHRVHRDHNYTSHGNNGQVAAPNDPDQPAADHVCSGGCQAGGWEQIYGTNPNVTATFDDLVDREWIAIQQETNTNHTNVDWASITGAQW